MFTEYGQDLSGAESLGTEHIVTAVLAGDVAAPPHVIDSHEIYSSQSIGIALRSDRYEWPEQILRDADIAMYEAKSKGRARHEFFDTKMHASIIDRLQTEAALCLAVEHHEGFQLHYQPILNMQTQKLMGFEALVRWNHGTRGMVYPGEFIPIAEETGMISSLSGWIIGEACRQLKVWQREYPLNPSLMMSINVSSRLLTQPDFVDSISTVLRETGLAPCTLALEITETVLLSHTEVAMETLTRLRDLGVQIHIDDRTGLRRKPHGTTNWWRRTSGTTSLPLLRSRRKETRMITVVMRPFDGPDGRLISGQLIDSSEWRNEHLLLDQRYLRPATEVEIKNAEEVEVDEAPPPQIRKSRK